jgi:hypothetical protein
MGEAWEIKTAEDVAEALDWLRRRMKGKGLLLVAIGTNSVAFCKDPKINPDQASKILEANLGLIKRGLAQARDQKVTRGSAIRDDVE